MARFGLAAILSLASLMGLSTPHAPAPPSVPGAEALPVAFAALAGWGTDDHGAAFATFLTSCRSRRSALPALRIGAAATPALGEACAGALTAGDLDGAAARRFFETHFTAWRIVPSEGRGFFTGYYEPEVEGSPMRQGRFATPIFARPPDLVTFGADDAPTRGLEGLTGGRRQPDGTLVPYPDRGEIEDGALDRFSLVLLYLADPIDRFFLQVQGSGRVRMPDGTVVRLAYDGRNGRPYTAIGRVMADRLGIPRAEMTMPVLRASLARDPALARDVMRENRSFVFFRIAGELDPSLGPIGGEGIPLVAGRSLAVDRKIWPYGLPVFVDAAMPVEAGQGERFRRLMVAQDTGSAIVGPARGDIFFGSGAGADAVAGLMRHPGDFIVLWPREAVGQPS